jgi:hypothetical protein
MSCRHRDSTPVTLVLPAEPPTQDEIDAVLMATDAIIGRAGRNGVVLILKGSRSQKAQKWVWDRLPDYGGLRHLTADQIASKVDWCIPSGSCTRCAPCAQPSTRPCRRWDSSLCLIPAGENPPS